MDRSKSGANNEPPINYSNSRPACTGAAAASQEAAPGKHHRNKDNSSNVHEFCDRLPDFDDEKEDGSDDCSLLVSFEGFAAEIQRNRPTHSGRDPLDGAKADGESAGTVATVPTVAVEPKLTGHCSPPLCECKTIVDPSLVVTTVSPAEILSSLGQRHLSKTTSTVNNKGRRTGTLKLLENVTQLSRSLIPPELFETTSNKTKHHSNWHSRDISRSSSQSRRSTRYKRNSNKENSSKMTEKRSSNKRGGLGSFRKRMGRKNSAGDVRDDDGAVQPQRSESPGTTGSTTSQSAFQSRRGRVARSAEPTKKIPPQRRYSDNSSADSPSSSSRQGRGREARGRSDSEVKGKADSSSSGGNLFQRIRERSRSRSRSRKDKGDKNQKHKEMLVAVTSCRSDGYYNQKAPGSTSKLPRKAPTNLKLFHEMAVGVKDAYAAVGATPVKVTDDEVAKAKSAPAERQKELEARKIMWDFVGNLDFLLALVDEVAVDTVTRGALKDDSTFKGLRDVIKKGNRVLEGMLVRRERKYTLFFRLVQPHDGDQIERMKNWNQKVERAVGAVTNSGRGNFDSDTDSSDNNSDAGSLSSNTSQASVSSRAGVFSRGRQLLPTAGRVRARRATPTPRMRKHRKPVTESESSSGNAAEDGFSTVTAENPLAKRNNKQGGEMLPNGLSAFQGMGGSQLHPSQEVKPKDELVDVIRGLRVEKIANRESKVDDDLAALKPNWRPKADVPDSVPKLPTEYVHRHRLMKQVVSCLLDENPRPPDASPNLTTLITCVTSRHGDKAGNGKSTLSIAVIQTVEVRERFSDGIAWLKLGRGPLTERDIRRLYEDLYRQLIVKKADIDESITDEGDREFHDSLTDLGEENPETKIDRMVDRADSVRRFEGGDLEGIKEDLARMLVSRKILVCLDDVWRFEDAKWFIFETPASFGTSPPREHSSYKLLISTRTPSLLGSGVVQEVFVRILSEHEAVKLLLSTAGRRPYGGRNSTVFNQSRLIVKGCGNSPLGIMLIGSMLRENNRNWNLKSPLWMGIYNQCSLNLEEAAQLRSFKNAFTRIVDTSFFAIENSEVRIVMRRCFVLFAMAFRANDWMLSGKGIPHSVIYKFFSAIISGSPPRDSDIRPDMILSILENLKLIQRARHSISPQTAKSGRDSPSNENENGDNSEKSESDWDEFDDMPKRPIQQFYTMHDSLKAVAEVMVLRPLPAFTPEADQYTFFSDLIEEEGVLTQGSVSSVSTPLSFIFQHGRSRSNGVAKSLYITEEQIHELVCAALVGVGDGKAPGKPSISEAMKANYLSIQLFDDGAKFEEYTTAFLPEHLMFAKAYPSAAELLTDSDFVRRRVFALGIMEATGRQVADILDVRNFSVKGNAKKVHGSPSKGSGPPGSGEPQSFDVDTAVCDASRIVIDEVYKVTNSMGSSDSLGMATCLATVGETLLKCRQPRDAMLRMEEAVSIYRGLLGPYHVYVAHALHSVAKALVKLGETRVALLKFAEAARIYEACDATLHYDSIANAQSLATLLVDIGDIRKAESMFEEVISMKQAVYGQTCVPVAKTINSYAILLAKHGRMNDALKHYELAKSTYLSAPPVTVVDPEFEIKCNYDVTLITLNIASIYSKKGDLQQALRCYEDGVQGLEEYEDSMDKISQMSGSPAASKGSSHKHLVAALGRIGSLKLKLGENPGALNAYLTLIEEVDDDSPLASHNEKAKAHIKCATIFRQRQGDKNREKSVSHLRESLRMYKALYGQDHKDTIAISASLKQWLAEDKQAAGK